MSLKDLSPTYCPHCSAPIDFIQDYRPGECPFCKGIISYDDVGGTIKGKFGLQHVVLILLVFLAIIFIGYFGGGR